MFKPVKKTRIYENIVSEIKEMIDQGKLISGDQLPSERELSETFKVSRTSVREALRILESQGFLESRQGNGTYIALKNIDALVQPLASVLLKEKDHQIELFEMRRLLESQLAYLAAERATGEDVNKLEQILSRQEEQIAKGNTGKEADDAFHYKIAEATKNRILLQVINATMEIISESRESYLLVEGRAEKSLIHHRKILNAIKAKDPKLAAQAMTEHIAYVEKKLFAG